MEVNIIISLKNRLQDMVLIMFMFEPSVRMKKITLQQACNEWNMCSGFPSGASPTIAFCRFDFVIS